MSSLRWLMGHSARFLVVLTLVVTSSLATVAAGQVTTISLSVEATEPWTVETEFVEIDGQAPTQPLTDGEHYVLILVAIDGGSATVRLDALKAMGAAPDSVVTIDQGDTGTIAYWLDSLSVGGQPWGSFTLARTEGSSDAQVITMYLGPVAGFADGLASAQGAITVNDEPVLDGVGGEGLEELLVAAAPESDTGGDATPEADTDEPATDEPTDEPTEEPADEPSGDDNDKFGGGDADEDVPYADVGMVGPRQYEGPQFGVEIEWTSDWDLDEDFGEAVTSDPKTGVDAVHLLWNEERAAWMMVIMFDRDGLTIPGIIDNIDAIAEDNFGEDASVAMANGSSGLGAAVFLLDEGSRDPTLVYEEYRLSADGGALIVVRMISVDPDVTESAIEAASEGIQIDGEPILIYFPPADVADVHAG